MLNSLARILHVLLLSGAIFFCCPSLLLVAAELTDSFSFEMEEFEKSPLEIGGYIETKWTHTDINEQGALASLKNYDDPVSTVDTFTQSIQIDGSYIKGIASLNWLLKASGQWTNSDWSDTADVYETYINLKPTNNLTASLGKKSYKWGKGYAWNPVGFLNRRKDPNNPDEALEGYITAEAEVIKSFNGTLQNVALTTVLIPVNTDINEDFDQEDSINLAAKLYLLYEDTDLDFLFYTGEARSSRFGFDFSRNLATNFEIHGEYAYFPNFEKIYLGEDGTSTIRKTRSAHSFLLGLRYLSESNLTSIIEYYHNGAGYSHGELSRFYQMVEEGYLEYTEQGIDTLLSKANTLGLQGYTQPYLGTDYLYSRFTLKEPWDILYFTPALTTIMNLDDGSFTLSPEMLYTGFTNWELRLRFSLFAGASGTEYGEKINDSKLELRVRRFF